MTVIGIPTIFVGSLILRQARQADIFNPSHFAGEYAEELCVGIITGGAVLVGRGISIDINGSSRKKIIKAQLTKFYDTTYIPSVGIIITF